MSALVARLVDPGPPRWSTLVLRVVLAAVFIPVGLGKFVNHDTYTERFERWGFGAAAGEVAILVGVVEVVCGVMLLLGVLPRLAALALAGNMIGALVTAGRVDGGQDIWLPLILIVALAAVVVWGGGRLALASGAGRLAGGALRDHRMRHGG
ncbi:MAG TPA: DoxX family protein [Miltoncostaeaceae bacterium]|nr:DoxX family protein [Miltoncostaeaceae bacterium]